MQPTLAPMPQIAAQDHVSEQSLREQLLAQVQSPQQQSSSHHSHLETMQHSSSASPHDHNNIDPAIAGNTLMSTSAESGGDDNGGDGRKGGKRELSTSKRAAQNRAAQRAFRQRKEGYIKKLEEQVRDYALLNENYKAVQAENYQLRDYIINLQSRLIESQGEFPQPPSNIDLPHPARSSADHNMQSVSQQPPVAQPPPTAAAMGPSAVSQLQASAARAVADMGSGKHHHEEAAYLTGSDFPSKRMRGGENAESLDHGSGLKAESNGTALAV